MEIFLKGLLIASATVGLLLGVYWLRLVRLCVEPFLEEAAGLCEGQRTQKKGWPLFYKREEVRGHYKGREVSIGIIYTGMVYEYVPLPYIRMKLRGDIVSFNIKRLSDYAVVEDGDIVYKVKPQIIWGVFDRQYQQIFSRKSLVVVLDSLFTAAENVETTNRSSERSS